VASFGGRGPSAPPPGQSVLAPPRFSVSPAPHVEIRGGAEYDSAPAWGEDASSVHSVASFCAFAFAARSGFVLRRRFKNVALCGAMLRRVAPTGPAAGGFVLHAEHDGFRHEDV
jgi:hypothetical protein